MKSILSPKILRSKPKNLGKNAEILKIWEITPPLASKWLYTSKEAKSTGVYNLYYSNLGSPETGPKIEMFVSATSSWPL